MKMNELVSWFQLEYPQMVFNMRESNHHLTIRDKVALEEGELIAFFEKNREFSVDINPYHQEGDVWTHTMMVCKQAESMPYEVQIAALLHDIGKPYTRKVNPKNSRVSFFNHDAVSAFMSLGVLNREELGLSREQKIEIFNLIAFHTQIFKLDLTQLAKLRSLSSTFLQNLFLLGHADHEGRFHAHEGSDIPSYESISGVSSTDRLRDTTKEVHILCGLPASGKSTYVHTLKKENVKTYVVSRDYFIENLHHNMSYVEAFKACDQKWVDKKLNQLFMGAKEEDRVVVDMTHMSKKSRRKSLSHFGSDYKKICHVFLTDLPTIKLRNSERHGKVIDERVYDRMMKSFYPPTYEEFDEIIYHI